MHTQVAGFHAEELRRHRAHDEVPLARHPQLRLAVGVGTREAGLRLDVALMHRRGLEVQFHDLISRGKACVDIAHLVLDALGDVRGLGRCGRDAARDHILEQQRRIGLHRLIDVDDVRQHFVIDFDQFQRLGGDGRRGRGDGGDSVSLIEDFLARHDVARHVPEIQGDALGADVIEFLLRKIRRSDHRLDAGQPQRFCGVDRADTRMRMRRAQDYAPQHARQREVGAILGKSRYLGHAVGTNRTGADDF